jgi:hypothetical protein
MNKLMDVSKAKVCVFCILVGLLTISSYGYAQSDVVNSAGQQKNNEIIQEYGIKVPEVPQVGPALVQKNSKTNGDEVESISPVAGSDGAVATRDGSADISAAIAGNAAAAAPGDNNAAPAAEEESVDSKPVQNVWDKLKRAPMQKPQAQPQQPQRYNIFQ